MHASSPCDRSSLHAVALALALLALSSGGCIAVGGTVHKAPEPTFGQQLIDLKEAERVGAIDTEEYERLRARLIAERTRAS